VLATLTAFAGAVIAGQLGFVRQSAAVVLPAILASVTVVTIVTFVADTAATDGWTTSRQAVGSLVGKDACGVASDLVVSSPTGEPPPQSVHTSEGRKVSSLGSTRYIRQPVELDRTGSTPWYPVGHHPIGLFVGGTWAPRDRLVVIWGRGNTRRVLELRSSDADLLASTEGPNAARWRFVAGSGLPTRPTTANLVRFRLISSNRSSGAQLTAPTASVSQPLTRLVSQGTQTLVSPFLFEAMPCAALPPLSYGVAGSPAMLVDWAQVLSLTNPTSPWAGLPDVLELDRIPVSSAVDHGPIFVYKVRVDPRDALAPARRSILS
jgi:hypothetical protein